ncbi:RHS repeat-associated core domain-containing protein, partial [Aeromonas veronii]
SYQLGDDKRRTDDQYRSFIYEPGSFKPLVQLEGEGTDAEVFHYQLDHLGTPLALTRDNGATAWQVRYRAYGNVWREEIAEVATPLRFQGQYFDAETGLHYNRHRYYQPETGRFITPDPIGLAGGLNNYQYAPNPIGWVDPLGLMKKAGQCPPGEDRYVYRALSPHQEEQALRGDTITAKDVSATYSIQEHINNGRLKTQFISTTKSMDTANWYAKANPRFGKTSKSPVIKIDRNQLDKAGVYDVSNGLDPETNAKLGLPGLAYAKKDKEVLILRFIPKNAYEVIK